MPPSCPYPIRSPLPYLPDPSLCTRNESKQVEADPSPPAYATPVLGRVCLPSLSLGLFYYKFCLSRPITNRNESKGAETSQNNPKQSACPEFNTRKGKSTIQSHPILSLLTPLPIYLGRPTREVLLNYGYVPLTSSHLICNRNESKQVQATSPSRPSSPIYSMLKPNIYLVRMTIYFTTYYSLPSHDRSVCVVQSMT